MCGGRECTGKFGTFLSIFCEPKMALKNKTYFKESGKIKIELRIIQQCEGISDVKFLENFVIGRGNKCEALKR